VPLRLRRPRTEPVPASGEVLRQVRRIELRTRGLVNSRFSGEYHSVFKGQGIEFAEVREYLPGDEVRTIDWNVTARLGHPYVKRYVEERELTVLLVVDLSGSLQWGSRRQQKAELVAEVAATLAMSAIRNNDRVGLLIVTDGVERLVPPRKGRRHALRLIRDLLAYRPESTGTDLAAGVEYATRLAPAGSILFLFSDFQLEGGWDAFARALTAASARMDVVAVPIHDPLDAALPPVGVLTLRDAESGRLVTVDTSSPRVQARHARLLEERTERLRSLLRRLQVDQVALRTDVPFAPALMSFFRRRERRRQR
jgi:uncharacterized protein (DUF58 family)